MKLTNKELKRNFSFDTSAVDEEQRTVSLAFSSETPVERAFGWEILDHSRDSVDLERLSDAAPLLVDHDPTDQVGVIERASIDDDRKGRVIVRFGRSARAQEIFNDVCDGIRKHVSVGYRIHDAERDEKADHEGLEAFRITRWTPHEVSIVSIPADHKGSGIGRSLDKSKEDIKMSEVNNAPSKEAQIDVDAIKNDAATKARSAEQARIREITKLTSAAKRNDMLSNAIEGGLSVDQVREQILDDVFKRTAAEEEAQKKSDAFVGMNEKEVREFSILRAAEAAASKDWSKAGLEKEVIDTIAKQTGRESRGFYIPAEVMDRSQQVKGTAADGGNLVGTDHLAGSFIENLRNNSVVMGLGPTVMNGLRGDVSIPRKTSSTGAYWLAEDGNATESKATFDNVTLSPKTVAVASSISRTLRLQSEPVADGIIMSDIVRSAALEIDLKALTGDGTANTPTGILNQTGVLTQTVADIGNVPTYAEMLGFALELEKANALSGSLHYLTTPTVKNGMMTSPVDAGSGVFLSDKAPYAINATNQMPAGRTLFGNFNDLCIGFWGVLDVQVDPWTNAASDGLVLRVFQSLDFALRHPESFCMDA